MFYTKLYAVAEYATEILLVWAIFKIQFVVGAVYLALRVCKFFLAPAAEMEIQTYRMTEAVAQTKAMMAKAGFSAAPKTPTEAAHEDVTLQ